MLTRKRQPRFFLLFILAYTCIFCDLLWAKKIPENKKESSFLDNPGNIYLEFKKFIIEEWIPEPKSQIVISEFIEEQLDRLKSLAANTQFWNGQLKYYQTLGQVGRIRCIRVHLSALKGTTAIAQASIVRLENNKGQDRVTGELFEELAQVGRVTRALTHLHDAIGNCMIEVEMKDKGEDKQAILEKESEVFKLSSYSREKNVPFETHFKLKPSRWPYK